MLANCVQVHPRVVASAGRCIRGSRRGPVKVALILQATSLRHPCASRTVADLEQKELALGHNRTAAAIAPLTRACVNPRDDQKAFSVSAPWHEQSADWLGAACCLHPQGFFWYLRLFPQVILATCGFSRRCDTSSPTKAEL